MHEEALNLPTYNVLYEVRSDFIRTNAYVKTTIGNGFSISVRADHDRAYKSANFVRQTRRAGKRIQIGKSE